MYIKRTGVSVKRKCVCVCALDIFTMKTTQVYMALGASFHANKLPFYRQTKSEYIKSNYVHCLNTVCVCAMCASMDGNSTREGKKHNQNNIVCIRCLAKVCCEATRLK